MLWWCVDNEAAAGPVKKQQLDHRAEAEPPAGPGVYGSSGIRTRIQTYTWTSACEDVIC